MATRRSIDSLAILGGTPAFPEKKHVGRPNIGNRDRFLERVNAILDSRWLTNGGRFEQELERRIADWLGVAHCIAVCNGTIALELVVRALGLSGEVIVPSFTFVATSHVLQWLNIAPAFCDIHPRTHNLDPAAVERRITTDTSAILGVHLWGRACDVDALQDIADRHRLRLVFDAAHAFGCSRGGTMIGNFGDAEVFSFHATKWFNTFEGGMIATNNPALAEKIRLMRNFGFRSYDTVSHLGTNGKMSEISAAMGVTSLDASDEFIEANRLNYEQYGRELRRLPGVDLVAFDDGERTTYSYVVLEIDETLCGVGRDTLQQVLWAENVIARRYFYPGCHRMEPYRTLYPEAGASLPATERLVHRVLVLPTGTSMSSDDISRVTDILRTALSDPQTLRGRLSATQVS